MWVAGLIVALLLLCLAIVLLADACRPMLILHLNERSSANRDRARLKRRPESRQDEAELDYLFLGLSQEDRNGFLLMWRSVRQEFDKNPAVAVLHADLLMSDLIEDYRGPEPTVDGQSGIFADSPLNKSYRTAHEVAVRSRQGRAKNQELKRAISLYDVLFDELLGSAKALAKFEREFEGTRHR